MNLMNVLGFQYGLYYVWSTTFRQVASPGDGDSWRNVVLHTWYSHYLFIVSSFTLRLKLTRHHYQSWVTSKLHYHCLSCDMHFCENWLIVFSTVLTPFLDYNNGDRSTFFQWMSGLKPRTVYSTRYSSSNSTGEGHLNTFKVNYVQKWVTGFFANSGLLCLLVNFKWVAK